jgi:ATP-binding cassette, subfamily B, multidrug efflux pump
MKAAYRPLAATFRNFLPLKEYFVRNRWALAFGLMSLLFVDFLQLVIPLIIKRAVDLLTTGNADAHALLRLGMAIMCIALLIALFRYVWRLLILGHSRKVEEGLRNRMYQHMQALSLSFFRRIKTGDLMARSINDLNAVRMAAGMGLVALTDGLVLGMAAVGFMMSISMKLTLISLVPAPLVVFLTRILTRRMSAGFESVQNTFSEMTEQIREAFAGIRVIKAYNREDWARARIRREGEGYIRENMNLARTLAFFFPLMTLFTNTGLAIVIWLGGRLTILGDISTGDFVAFISYLNLLTWPMMAMGWVTNLIQRGSASMRRINRILEEVPEITDPPAPFRPSSIKGGIRAGNLTMRYPGQTQDALKDLEFSIEAGETVALVGRVGSGKTTFLQMIPRILEAPFGTLFVDGRDIRELPLSLLRGNIGFVTQEVFLFSDTVRNNIIFGRTGITDDELQGLLRAAHIAEEVEALERGLDTMLGERGVTLSGGQRQRISIARALAADPPILILDDALSMVDTRTEELILNRILESRSGKTNLIVSHRVSTIGRADRTLVFDRGRLVEEGDHQTLLGRGGLYSTLYRKQILLRELEAAD